MVFATRSDGNIRRGLRHSVQRGRQPGFLEVWTGWFRRGSASTRDCDINADTVFHFVLSILNLARAAITTVRFKAFPLYGLIALPTTTIRASTFHVLSLMSLVPECGINHWNSRWRLRFALEPASLCSISRGVCSIGINVRRPKPKTFNARTIKTATTEVQNFPLETLK